MNHKVSIRAAGGLEQIVWVEAAVPTPAEGEVLVRVEAAGAAFGDVLLRRGVAGGRFPVTPGYDLVGVVEALGLGTGRFRVGDRVVGFPGQGAQQERVCVPELELAAVPLSVSPEMAVAAVLNYHTALQLLTRDARLKPGDSAFLYGLAGGLGGAVRDVAAQLGVRVYGTASGQRLGEAGRNATAFDRSRPDWVAEARRAEPGGFDAVFDPLGGKSLSRSFGLLSRRGTLFMLGAASTVQGDGSPRMKLAATLARFLWLKLRPGGRRVRLFLVETAAKRPDSFNEDMARLFGWLVDGRIDPKIHATLPLSEARAAQEMLERGDARGKVVLVASR